MNNDLKTIGKRIKDARKAAEMTQHQLGEIVGVKHGAISKYERGEADPGSLLIKLIADACSVTVESLITGKTSGPQSEESIVKESQDVWKINGTPPNDFEQRIIGMLRRLPADQRQAFVDLITTAYFDHMENK